MMIISDKRSSQSFADAPEATVDVKQITAEIATVARDTVHTVSGQILENYDETLKSKGASDGLAVYDKLERDCHAFAVLQKRKLAVISREWFVEAASDDPKDQECAEEVKRQLKNIQFDQVCLGLADANLKGYAVGEIIWGVIENKVVATKVIMRDQRRFTFGVDRLLRLFTPENKQDGVPVPAGKFIVHTFGAKDGSPYGLGLGTRIFWPVFFKRQGLTFWLTFCDKFGSPTAIGKYPVGTSKADQDKLLEALGAIAQDAGIIVPEGMLVEFLEAARSGSIDTYEKLCRYMDEQISEAVLGETGTTNQSASGGSNARDQVGNEVRLEIAKADSDIQCDTLNQTLIKWVANLNFPEANPPKVWRAFQQGEDLRALAYRDRALAGMGLAITKKYFYEKYNIPAPNPGEEVIELQPDTGGGGAAFAEDETLSKLEMPAPRKTVILKQIQNKIDQNEMEKAADDLAGGYEKLLGSRVDDLVAMFEETNDFGLFKKKLIQFMNDQPPKETVQALERSTFAAGLIGRAQRK